MGNSESIDIPGGGTDGYHILRVQENSPGSKVGLQPFFDFIVAINGTRLDRDNDTLKQILKNGIGKQLPLTIYSCKTQSVRSVTVEPSDSWGGQGLLGISIRFCSFEVAKENVWHILEVHPNSPASLAGLRPFSDYIIGSDSILHESEDLFNLIENHDGVSLKLYVYNSDEDSCREISITPNSQWGGEGLVGCGIGYGYLHRIPVRSTPKKPNTVYKPGETSQNLPPKTVVFNVPPVNTDNINAELPNMTNLVQSTASLTSQAGQGTTVASLTTAPSNTQIVSNEGNGQPINSTFASAIAMSTSTTEVYSTNLPPPSSIPQFSVPPNVQHFSSMPTSVPPTNEGVQQIPMYAAQPPTVFNPNLNYQNLAAYSYPQSQFGNMPVYSNYSQPQVQEFNQPNLYSAPTITNSSLPPPPLSGFQANQNKPLILDPTIAARSAQLLLSGNVSTSS
ncbi:Golgi reassembly-stacking protein 2 [Anoplophora glabripennis]|uniref:Golgi reassembly-stacking protein 2 n=1 Tax=Anoplophora glabripennis TaxID=217634 RepID=UPI0008751652|nr:Golgi reassembly-stacking protein 2 [Anoplophora glabripennis]